MKTFIIEQKEWANEGVGYTYHEIEAETADVALELARQRFAGTKFVETLKIFDQEREMTMTTVLSRETKILKVRKAFADLANVYMMQGKSKQAKQVHSAAEELEQWPESLVRLHDILTATTAEAAHDAFKQAQTKY